MAHHYLGTVDEFTEDEPKIVDVKGRSVGIYKLSGKLHAILNYCPHQGAHLCKGPVTSWVTSPLPGQFVYEQEGEIVRCPWHHWEFDIKTGGLVVDNKVRTKTYEVVVETFDLSVEQGKVYIEM
ncbi:Rieske (2Fe-2S) protein [Paenibacillus radicis (ex Xue et al. 2023)]|uniref:Rieske (2Fe-2S) protein n=1 Tax=Paenibacillus radicis (ex Xue et al. 2023) TaxID=2972489 RepID=A0ABT1YLX9_9BACL|nr:Rieske (2Fe-2S) protein [Paenibacillus radicis (ex Xue et al. 2023)]MCR8634188.1 Rieske (2Fe-2S) protein [Paenibacillus radicis (ex Xue et al. 2023)]